MRRRRRRSMIFLINFSGNRYFLKLLLVSVFLSGCAVSPVAAPEYRIDLSAGMKSLIAVMPVENLAGMPIPVQALRISLIEAMKRKGLNILGEDVLARFMERHRVRYAGGLNRELPPGPASVHTMFELLVNESK